MISSENWSNATSIMTVVFWIFSTGVVVLLFGITVKSKKIRRKRV